MSTKQTPNLHRDWIDSHAFGIVKALQKRGFETYLVGGCVRDLLLGNHPKDYDIATKAKPNEVKRTIYNSYVIGKRFRLVLVKREAQQFEVATFRRNVTAEDNSEDIPDGDNLFGTPEEDANRRDFTINGLFYDPVNDKLLDWANGLADLEAGVIRMIGDPDVRLPEDPIRILRGIRLAHMIRFGLEPNLRRSMCANSETLKETALPRRREEWLKFLRLPDPTLPFIECYDLEVLKFVAPHLHELFENQSTAQNFIDHLKQIHRSSPYQPVELFCGLFWAYYRSAISDDPDQPLKTKEISENEDLANFMRNELGMFKYEQEMIAKAFHLENVLIRRGPQERERPGRRAAILRNEAFPLAIQLAQLDLAIPQEEINAWLDLYGEALPEISERRDKRPKRRRRRPRQRKPKQSKQETSS